MDTADMTPTERVLAAAELLKRVADGPLSARLAARGELTSILNDVTFDLIREAHEDSGASWQFIAEQLGEPRQTVIDRWSRHVDDPTPHVFSEGRAPGETWWWKMNVDPAHVKACRKALRFGLRKPLRMERGDVLLLQEKLIGGRRVNAERISFALIYEDEYIDPAESRALWKTNEFPLIVRASECYATMPFSLEDLGLKDVYVRQGQMNHQRIHPEHLDLIRKASGLTELGG